MIVNGINLKKEFGFIPERRQRGVVGPRVRFQPVGHWPGGRVTGTSIGPTTMTVSGTLLADTPQEAEQRLSEMLSVLRPGTRHPLSITFSDLDKDAVPDAPKWWDGYLVAPVTVDEIPQQWRKRGARVSLTIQLAHPYPRGETQEFGFESDGEGAFSFQDPVGFTAMTPVIVRVEATSSDPLEDPAVRIRAVHPDGNGSRMIVRHGDFTVNSNELMVRAGEFQTGLNVLNLVTGTFPYLDPQVEVRTLWVEPDNEHTTITSASIRYVPRYIL